MKSRDDLQKWICQALKSFNGEGSIVDVAKYIWQNHENELKSSGDLFYTWQYDMRWAATKLRENKEILPAEKSQKGIWKLA
ncbi:hypothetical protein MNB_SM-5-383 [hydrothermal vent metagenome]|uniref:Restriction system protein Mrr-like N-terminal domain-containing protein n=1 Tax=hydrothermal vent metagenome TaxID=652676 RepID=A0A1W1C748_9ZZZZ